MSNLIFLHHENANLDAEMILATSPGYDDDDDEADGDDDEEPADGFCLPWVMHSDFGSLGWWSRN